MSEEDSNCVYDNKKRDLDSSTTASSPHSDSYSQYNEEMIQLIILLTTNITTSTEVKRDLVENINKFLQLYIEQRKNELESEQDHKFNEFIRIVVSLINDYLKLVFLCEEIHDKENVDDEINNELEIIETKVLSDDHNQLNVQKSMNDPIDEFSFFESGHAKTPNTCTIKCMDLNAEPENMEDIASSSLNSQNLIKDSNIPTDSDENSEDSQSSRNRSELMSVDSPSLESINENIELIHATFFDDNKLLSYDKEFYENCTKDVDYALKELFQLWKFYLVPTCNNQLELCQNINYYEQYFNNLDSEKTEKNSNEHVDLLEIFLSFLWLPFRSFGVLWRKNFEALLQFYT
ncbi:6605_t:CDS:2 [Ambispora leptoticha]|uniref:6605_t:CDS:1 n=1 Tax=Ambispora leptoticha TaxID=144679 RepID=A0A9N9GRA8_9GLOM|nr:6605_t:CDS:2 [Ambispora leptoticha]